MLAASQSCELTVPRHLTLGHGTRDMQHKSSSFSLARRPRRPMPRRQAPSPSLFGARFGSAGIRPGHCWLLVCSEVHCAAINHGAGIIHPIVHNGWSYGAVLGGVKASTPTARSLLDPACAPGGHVRRSAPRNGPSVSPRNTSEKTRWARSARAPRADPSNSAIRNR